MSQLRLSPAEQEATYGPKLDDLRRQSAKDYSTELEFHNFVHPLKTEIAATDIHKRLEALHVPGLPSLVVVRYATIKHDAGLPKFYGLSPFPKLDPNLYSCPEELSIEIAREDGRAAGFDEATLDEVEETIWATAAGHPITSWGGMILCVADLRSAASDYHNVFLPDGAKLRRERVVAKKEDLGEQGYKDFSVGLLSTYVVKNLRSAHFGGEFDPQAIFAPEIKAIEHNVDRLATERAQEDGISIQAYAARQGGDVPAFFEAIAA